MAQGTIKKSTRAKAPKATHSKRQVSKVGQAKKNKTAADHVHRKFTAGMAAKTEAMLGERVGHLELIGTKKKGAKRVAKAGGSKKFG